MEYVEGSVLGIVSPALLDDADDPSTSLAFGLPTLYSASLREFVSTITPSKTVGATFFRLAIDDVAMLGQCGRVSFLPFLGIPMFFTYFSKREYSLANLPIIELN